jgi:hypothetical protein
MCGGPSASRIFYDLPETIRFIGRCRRSVDFTNGLCQLGHSSRRKECNAMKVNVEVECTPEEARRFLGLPDVTKANEAYVDAVVQAMQGSGNLDQLRAMTTQFAPMGEMGMKMFQNFMEGGMLRPKKD